MKSPNNPSPGIVSIIAAIFILMACNFPTVMIAYPEINLPPLQVIIRHRENIPPAAYSLVTRTPFLPLPSPSVSSTLISTMTSTMPPTMPPTPLFTPTETITQTPTQTDTLTLTPPQNPTSTETATPFPSETLVSELPQGFPPQAAQIEGMVGYFQYSSLDCEARSAVDFAAFLGFVINEMDFLALLPKSDDPEQGFVGNYWDAPGQIPPDSYGVHAYPVAALLRNYGVNAFDIKGMAYEDLQREIASGRPVIVWVVGNTIGGVPLSYTASNGNTTTVARFEHTVIVIGYQPSYLTILDGGMIYYRSVDTFFNSWGTLGNMAIVFRPD